MKSDSCWININGEPAPALADELGSDVRDRKNGGFYNEAEVRRIEKLNMFVCSGALSADSATIDKLRRLCQLWDVDLRTTEITSHRRFIGPLIVWAKKAVYPVLRVFLKDALRQQRDFNATVISLLAHQLDSRADKPLK